MEKCKNKNRKIFHVWSHITQNENIKKENHIFKYSVVFPESWELKGPLWKTFYARESESCWKKKLNKYFTEQHFCQSWQLKAFNSKFSSCILMFLVLCKEIKYYVKSYIKMEQKKKLSAEWNWGI